MFFCIIKIIVDIFRAVGPVYSPECGDMNAADACGAAGPAEPGLPLKDLKAGGLWDAMLDPPELGKLFSQPADTRNWASGERSDGAWGAKSICHNSKSKVNSCQQMRKENALWEKNIMLLKN